MTYSVPVEVYEAIRDVVKDDILAKDLIKTIEKGLNTLEQKAKEQKHILKAEIKNELTNELATKGDLEVLRQELKGDIRVLEEKINTFEWKIKLWFVLLTGLILFTNRETIGWIFKLIGILK